MAGGRCNLERSGGDRRRGRRHKNRYRDAPERGSPGPQPVQINKPPPPDQPPPQHGMLITDYNGVHTCTNQGLKPLINHLKIYWYFRTNFTSKHRPYRCIFLRPLLITGLHREFSALINWSSLWNASIDYKIPQLNWLIVERCRKWRVDSSSRMWTWRILLVDIGAMVGPLVDLLELLAGRVMMRAVMCQPPSYA